MTKINHKTIMQEITMQENINLNPYIAKLEKEYKRIQRQLDYVFNVLKKNEGNRFLEREYFEDEKTKLFGRLCGIGEAIKIINEHVEAVALDKLIEHV